MSAPAEESASQQEAAPEPVAVPEPVTPPVETEAETVTAVAPSPVIEAPKKPVIPQDREVTKQTVRRCVWDHLERNGLSSFPRPVYGRIPNFKGAEQSAARLPDVDAYRECATVEVNPDKPQEAARILALESGKRLYVPVPRLKEGLLKYIKLPPTEDGAVNVKTILKQTVSRKGIEQNGETVGLSDDVRIDVLVVGSVAVSREGYRIGKGRGYADLEYAILREMEAVNENTIVVTNVHDSQVFETLPKELFKEHDMPIDYILTPNEIICIENRLPRPKGIYWNLLSQRRIGLMPILKSLKELHESQGKDTTLKEVDTDVESHEQSRSRKFRKFSKRRRPQSTSKSDTQGDGDASENAKPPLRRRQRFFNRRRPQSTSDQAADGQIPAPVDTSTSGEGNNVRSTPQNGTRRNQRGPPRRSFFKNRLQIDFSLMVSNIEKTVRVRDLKNALIEKGIKPSDITWRGYRGFCYLHYAKPNLPTKLPEPPSQVNSIIEILQNMKISPNSETNLSVKIMEPISRIRTTDITAV